jgi:hypothetical protein
MPLLGGRRSSEAFRVPATPFLPRFQLATAVLVSPTFDFPPLIGREMNRGEGALESEELRVYTNVSILGNGTAPICGSGFMHVPGTLLGKIRVRHVETRRMQSRVGACWSSRGSLS